MARLFRSPPSDKSKNPYRRSLYVCDTFSTSIWWCHCAKWNRIKHAVLSHQKYEWWMAYQVEHIRIEPPGWSGGKGEWLAYTFPAINGVIFLDAPRGKKWKFTSNERENPSRKKTMWCETIFACISTNGCVWAVCSRGKKCKLIRSHR